MEATCHLRIPFCQRKTMKETRDDRYSSSTRGPLHPLAHLRNEPTTNDRASLFCCGKLNTNETRSSSKHKEKRPSMNTAIISFYKTTCSVNSRWHVWKQNLQSSKASWNVSVPHSNAKSKSREEEFE